MTEIFRRAIPWTVLMLRYRIFCRDLNLQSNSLISVFLLLSTIFVIFLISVDARFGCWALVNIAGLLYFNRDFYRFLYAKADLVLLSGAFSSTGFRCFYSLLGLFLGVGLRFMQIVVGRHVACACEQNHDSGNDAYP